MYDLSPFQKERKDVRQVDNVDKYTLSGSLSEALLPRKQSKSSSLNLRPAIQLQTLLLCMGIRTQGDCGQAKDLGVPWYTWEGKPWTCNSVGLPGLPPNRPTT